MPPIGPSSSPPDGRDALRLRPGTELLGRREEGGAADFVVRRADGVIVHLTELLYLVCAAVGVDPGADVDDLAREVSHRYRGPLRGDSLVHLVATKLEPAGIVEWIDPRPPAGSTVAAAAAERSLPPPRPGPGVGRAGGRTDRALAVVPCWLFRPMVPPLWLAALVAVEAWLAGPHRRALTDAVVALARTPLLLVAVAGLVVASAAGRQLGQAAAARCGRDRPGLHRPHLLWPVLGGVYVDLIVLVAVAVAYRMAPWPPLAGFLLVAPALSLRHVLPFVQPDGYHLARLTALNPGHGRLTRGWVHTAAVLLGLGFLGLVGLTPLLLGAAVAEVSSDVAAARSASMAGRPLAALPPAGDVVLLLAALAGVGSLLVLLVEQVTTAAVRWHRRRRRTISFALVASLLAVGAQVALVWPSAVESSRDGSRTSTAGPAPTAEPDPTLSGTVPLGSGAARPLGVNPDGSLQPIPTVAPPPTTSLPSAQRSGSTAIRTSIEAPVVHGGADPATTRRAG